MAAAARSWPRPWPTCRPMLDALAFIGGAAIAVAGWLLLRPRRVTPTEAGKALSQRAADKRKAERSRYIAAHVATLRADIERELARKDAR